MEFKMAGNYLAHYGIKGQKWYERRFQNPDGSLTALGRIRYGVGEGIKKAIPRARILVNNKKKKYETLKEVNTEELSKEEQKANKKELSKLEKELNKQELEELAEQEKEEARQKAIRSGKATEILKYQDQMSIAELNEAVNRMRTVASINQQVESDAKKIQELTDYNKPSHKIARGIMKLADVSMQAVNTGQKFVDAYKKAKKWLDDDDDKDEDDIKKIPLDKALSKLNKWSAADLAVLSKGLDSRNSILAGGKKPQNKDSDNDEDDDDNDDDTGGSSNTQGNQSGGKKKSKKGKKGNGQGNTQQNNESSENNDTQSSQPAQQPAPKKPDKQDSHENDYDPTYKSPEQQWRDRVTSNNRSQLIKEDPWEEIQKYWNKRNSKDTSKWMDRVSNISLDPVEDTKVDSIPDTIDLGQEIIKSLMSLQHSATKRTIKVYVKR